MNDKPLLKTVDKNKRNFPNKNISQFISFKIRIMGLCKIKLFSDGHISFVLKTTGSYLIFFVFMSLSKFKHLFYK